MAPLAYPQSFPLTPTSEARSSVEARCYALIAAGTKPTLDVVRPLVDDFYALPGNGAGGALHCVLDDDNYERCHIQSTIDENSDPTATLLARVLLLLSNSQRRRL